jgi:hypothetical protein
VLFNQSLVQFVILLLDQREMLGFQYQIERDKNETEAKQTISMRFAHINRQQIDGAAM